MTEVCQALSAVSLLCHYRLNVPLKHTDVHKKQPFYPQTFPD